MRLSKLVTLVGILALSGNVFANVTPDIKLQGGVAKPHGSFSVDLGKLLTGVKYRVNCFVASDHLANQGSHAIQVSSNYRDNIYVNGHPSAATNGQMLVSDSELIWVASELLVKGGEYLTIRNLDDTSSLTVTEDCYAYPITGE